MALYAQCNGIMVWLAAAAVWAQPPEFPVPYFPAPQQMNTGQLEQILADWDLAVQERNQRTIERIVSRVSTLAGSTRVVRYANPALHDRIVNLFFQRLRQQNEADYVAEDHGEFFTALETMAVSTFSPRLLEYILSGAGNGSVLRGLYLAKVHPEGALDVLLAAKRGKVGEPKQHPDFLYLADGTGVFGVDTAFRFLSLTGEINPEVLLARRGEVRAFVRDHAKHFSGLQEVPYREEPIYRRWRDYPVRSDALGVLEVIATPGDADLVRSLVEDLPPPLPDDAHSRAKETKAREDLHAKADAILERIAP